MINDLYPNTLVNTFYASHDNGQYAGKNLYRPIPMLTFAVNWYWGKDTVAGYHVVNIFVHVLSSIFLFLTLINLFKAPNLTIWLTENRYSIALMSTLLWAIHPIQTQAVTYIVQRMAAMAGMFFIASLYVYVKARLTPYNFKKIIFFLVSLLFFICALLSKENAVMLPLVILVMEFVFFQNLSDKTVRKKFLILLFLASIAFIMLSTVFFLDNNLFKFLDGYEKRYFTLAQRLLTEPRILIQYLCQILYPVDSMYSLEDNMPLSTSLFSPWTTLPAICIILFLMTAGFRYIRKYPFFSFAVFFFFLNHLIESSFFPLEIRFEHRNYLPSMFLFVPLTAGVLKGLDFYRQQPQKKMLFWFFAAGFTCLVFLLGLATYTRNFVWATEEILYRDAIEKAPERARPRQNYALYHYQKKGAYDEAISLYKKALKLQDPSPAFSRMISYDNIRTLYMMKKDYDAAVFYGEKAVKTVPEGNVVRFNYAISLVYAGKLEQALEQINILRGRGNKNIPILKLKSRILLMLGKDDPEDNCFLKSVQYSPLDDEALMYFGLDQLRRGNHTKADHVLNQSKDRILEKMRFFVILSLLENSIRHDNKSHIDRYAQELITGFSVEELRKGLVQLETEKNPLVKLSYEKIYAVIAEQLNMTIKKMIHRPVKFDS